MESDISGNQGGRRISGGGSLEDLRSEASYQTLQTWAILTPSTEEQVLLTTLHHHCKFALLFCNDVAKLLA
jgi:hypothetical protein